MEKAKQSLVSFWGRHDFENHFIILYTTILYYFVYWRVGNHLLNTETNEVLEKEIAFDLYVFCMCCQHISAFCMVSCFLQIVAVLDRLQAKKLSKGNKAETADSTFGEESQPNHEEKPAAGEILSKPKPEMELCNKFQQQEMPSVSENSTSISQSQCIKLQEFYKLSPYPGTSTVEHLARVTKLETCEIHAWFRNQRLSEFQKKDELAMKRVLDKEASQSNKSCSLTNSQSKVAQDSKDDVVVTTPLPASNNNVKTTEQSQVDNHVEITPGMNIFQAMALMKFYKSNPGAEKDEEIMEALVSQMGIRSQDILALFESEREKMQDTV